MESKISQLTRTTQRLEGNEGSDVWGMINAAADASPVQPVANMGQGFFGYSPPDFVLDAARETVYRADCHQYSPTKGRPRLLKAVAKVYSTMLDREINHRNEVAITTGANEGLFSALMAFVDTGDEVIILEPFFNYYSRAVRMAGGVSRYVPLKTPRHGAHQTSHAAEWELDLELLSKAVTPKTRAIILNTPHNPTGKVFSRQELEGLASICVKNSIIAMSDDVYDSLSFVSFTRLATISPEMWNLTLTIGSAGKTFYVTGWRVGYVVGPAHLVEPVATAHRSICFAAPSGPQEAVAIAYEAADRNGFWEYTRNSLESKMKRFNEIWDELEIPYTVPEGAYYVLVNTSRIEIPEDFTFPAHMIDREPDYKMSWFFIQRLGVAALPLSDFYCAENKTRAAEYLRFAVCKPDADLDLAKSRLRGLQEFLH